MIFGLVLIFFTSLQNFIAIKQEKPCLRRKYGDFQKVLSDPCLNIAELVYFLGAAGRHCFDLRHMFTKYKVGTP